MPVRLDDLNNLASGLRGVCTSPSPVEAGQIVSFEITPHPSQLSAFDLLSVIGLTKSVLYQDAFPIPPPLATTIDSTEVLGGMPAGTGVTGVPGSLGQVEGLVALGVPVGVQARWSVTRNGAVVAEGQEFVAPSGAQTPEPTFQFFPVVQMELNEAIPVLYLIHATVKLSAGGVETSWMPLPAVPLLVRPIPIPIILALFRREKFFDPSGDRLNAAMIIVPQNSPIRDADDVKSQLAVLRATVSRVRSFLSFGAFLSGLQDLTSALNLHTRIVFVPANEIPNLQEYTLVVRDDPRPGENRPNVMAHDQMESLIFIGPTGTGADCAEHPAEKEGRHLTVMVTEAMFVTIRSLDNPHGSSASTAPIPPVIQITPQNASTKFNRVLSSVELLGV